MRPARFLAQRTELDQDHPSALVARRALRIEAGQLAGEAVAFRKSHDQPSGRIVDRMARQLVGQSAGSPRPLVQAIALVVERLDA